jgi:hypothetical protein
LQTLRPENETKLIEHIASHTENPAKLTKRNPHKHYFCKVWFSLASKRRFDVVTAWAIDRLGRSLIDLLGTIQGFDG